MNRQQLENLIREERFQELFVGHGWDIADESLPLSIKSGGKFNIQIKVRKTDFFVCFCRSNAVAQLSAVQKKQLIRELSKRCPEHLLIVHGKTPQGKKAQSWLLRIRPQNSPHHDVIVDWQEGQSLQRLLEKLDGLVFSLTDEGELTLIDVVQRVRRAFVTNNEKVTKEFYDEFNEKHDEFISFIEGIKEHADKQRYASLMLNRLMFVYFIQKKGFLSGESDYLQKRLVMTKKKHGEDKFHDMFYRDFLRQLFHGLNTPAKSREIDGGDMLGKVPYINGGLFDFHRLETENENISIKDAAFEKLFAFFDGYNWHLDSRPGASGKDINPDVLGYIFEKYINNQAENGAYYTREDITHYIAKNAIIPFLLSRAQENCKNAFAESGIWRFLRDNPERYIYSAVKHGTSISDAEIPAYIAEGIPTDKPDLLKRRKRWNESAPEKFALPGETWREVIARRQQHAALCQKIKGGGISEISGLISHNLDITEFVDAALADYEGTDFIAAMFRALAGVKPQWGKKASEKPKRGISVLDPACGSGAFLFAALNILKPVYEVCVERMVEARQADDERCRKNKNARQRHPLFRAVLEEIEQHRNRTYWIYKTIILQNLYGVDWMEDAAEVAKLRLFLKLAAEAEYDAADDNCGLEPLPDIDHNIRSGNSLVGYANMEQFRASHDYASDRELKQEIEEQAQEVHVAYDAFKSSQENDHADYAESKKDLTSRLEALNKKLNDDLASKSYSNQTIGGKKPANWLKSHKPFHWLAEFYDIVDRNGGFDVIIGNPPYVEYSKIKYKVHGFRTSKNCNIYFYFIELVQKLLKEGAFSAMIVPVSLPSTPRADGIRRLLENTCSHLYVSGYASSPSTLFQGVAQRLAIYVARKSKSGLREMYTTNFMRWDKKSRDALFETLSYLPTESCSPPSVWKKYGAPIEKIIHSKIAAHHTPITDVMKRKVRGSALPADAVPLYINKGIRHWVKALLAKQQSNEYVTWHAVHGVTASQCAALLNSSLFFWHWEILGDCWHLNLPEISSFNINVSEIKGGGGGSPISRLGDALNADLEHKKVYVGNKHLEYEYRHKRSKSLIDEIDVALARHYGFTEEELDYIINYAIKYRMGDR